MTRNAAILLVLLLVGVLAPLGYVTYYRAIQSPEQRSDFVVLYAAGRAALDGGDVYGVKHPRGWPYFYPPGGTLLLAGVAWLPFPAAVVAWYLLNAGAYVWACARLVRMCDEIAGRPVGPLVVLAGVLNILPLGTALQRGQLAPLLFGLLVEALWCYRRGRTLRTGVWLGLAAAIKLYPAVVVLPLIVRREWRGLAGFTGCVALLWFILPPVVLGQDTGWQTTGAWLRGVLLPFLTEARFAEQPVFDGINQFAISNQSFFGVLSRWLARDALPAHEPFAGTLANLSTGAIRVLAGSLALVLLGLMAWLAARRTDRHGLAEAALWSLPMLAANFISHIAWNHYFLVLTLPYALLAVAAHLERPGTRRRWWLVVALVLAVGCNWASFGVWTLRQAGLLLFGSLLLWCVLAAGVWGARRGWNAALSTPPQSHPATGP